MRRQRNIEPLNLSGWRSRILEALPQCRARVDWAETKLNRCESDLERVFVMLLAVLTTEVSNVSFAGEYPPDSSGDGKRYVLDFAQQVAVAGYRCDFMLTVRSVNSGRSLRVAIECDGHSFHDRTPEQASSDRQRDRKLITLGISTLRYTFSDLTQRPHEFMRDLFTTIRAIANNFCDAEARQ
jgi:very-short-patch-repair endonuclease